MTQEQEQAVEILVNEYKEKLIEIISRQNKMIKPNPLINDAMERIIEDVSLVTNISVQEIKARRRKTEILLARQLSMYMIYETIYKKIPESVSLQQIGSHMGKDHATVLHSVRVINDYIDTKNKYVMQILDVLNDESKIAA
jgi:chromosomal replication initiator protein